MVAPPLRVCGAGIIVLLLISCTQTQDGRRSAQSNHRSAAFEPSAEDLVGLGDPIVPSAGNHGYDARRYLWDLEIDPESNTLTSTASMRAVALESRARVTLDFSGPRVTDVRINGEAAEYARADGKLVVNASVAESDRFEIEVDYGGTPEPVLGAGRGWLAKPGSIRTFSLLPGDAAGWAPLNDSPLDPARYTLRITVPDPFVATASGTLVETLAREDRKTFVWKVDLPVTEVTFAVGEYRNDRVIGPSGLTIDIAFPTDAAVADIPSLKQLPNMLAFLQARLGPFPFPSLGLTFVWLFGGGGDSTPGRINLSDVQEIGLVHELAHQWMGGSVGTASSQDAWLREGLPTYVEALWTARRHGAQAGESMIENFRRQLGPSTRPPLDVDDLADRSDDVTYLRGALVMHALRLEVGEQAFFRALKAFFKSYRGRSASTKDFIDTVERVVGRDLTNFFTAWLSRERVPQSRN
jgi:aminopeptidase N